jgi:D-glycero-alpha-D-manno-heptose 1-phosphate guanylyltransferase
VEKFGTVITAAVLAGGLGTRLRHSVSDLPKVLAPVAGRPFLQYVLDQVAEAGVHKVVLCTGYLGEQVSGALGGRYGRLRLCYSHEARPMGTAGALRLALPLLDGDPLLVLNGDSYCEVGLHEFVAWHRECAAGAGSLLVTWVEDAARYGTVEVDDSGAVRSFREKRAEAAPGWISAGIYLLSRRLLTSIPAGRVVSIERDVFPAWVGGGLRAYRIRAPFIDIGTPESYAEAEGFFAERRASRLRGSEIRADAD